MRRLFTGLAAGLLAGLVALAGARAQTVDEIIARGKVLIAVDPTSAPFGVTGPDGQPDGYDVDVAKLVAKRLGVQLELVPVTSTNRIPYLLTNRVDMVISLFSITAERALQVWFSIPYASVGTVLTTRKDRPLHALDELKGLKVGVPRGTIPDIILSKKAPDGTQILRFDDEATSIQAMMTGQVDVLGSSTTALRLLNRGKAEKDFEARLTLTENHFGIGIRRGQIDLLRWLDTFVYDVRNSGDLDAICEKWTGEHLRPLPSF